MLKVTEISQEDDAETFSMVSDESGSILNSDSDTSIHRLQDDASLDGRSEKSKQSKKSKRSKQRHSRKIKTAKTSMVSTTSISRLSDLDGSVD